MKGSRVFLLHLLLLLGLTGCHSAAHRVTPSGVPPQVVEPVPEENNAAPAQSDSAERSADTPVVAQEPLPPCLPGDSRPKPVTKRKPKPVIPQRVAPSEAPAPAPTAAAGDAQLRTITVSTSSLLGRKVQGLDGEDMGRVVDVLTDTTGNTRIAIIEFGGFLGVGNRRLAVEWSLLKFHPQDPSAPLTLNVSKALIQASPEYKDSSARPPVLMPPAAATPDAGL